MDDPTDRRKESNSDLRVMNYAIDSLTANKGAVGVHDFICLRGTTQNNYSSLPDTSDMADRRDMPNAIQ